MKKNFLNKLKQKTIFSLGIFFAFITFLIPQISHADALLPGSISTCGELALSGIYTLTQNISAVGTSTCFTISADGVIIDGGGFTVSGTGAVAIDARARTGGITGTLTEGVNGYTNLIVNNLNISGFTTGINLSGNADATGLGTANGYGGNGGDVAIYNSTVGSVITQGGNSSTMQYGGLGGNIMFTHTSLNISNSTLSALGGTGTLGINIDGGLTLKYTGTLTKTNVVLSSFSFFHDNGTQYGIYVGGTWPLLPGSISTCGTLYGAGVYTLSQSISGISGTCFIVGSNDVTLDGAGYTISPAISTTTSYVINTGIYSNFTLGSTTVTNFSNLINSSSSVTLIGNTLNLTSKKITALSTTIDAGTLNLASSTFITNTLNINYSTSITGTFTASSSALSYLTINNLDYGPASSGFIFNDVWVSRAIDASRNWQSITSSADGKKLAAVTSTYIYTSTNGGATWATSTSAGSRAWYSITSSFDGTKLAAVAWGSEYIYTSIDSGATWTKRINAGAKEWVSIASSADGTKLVAAVGLAGGYTYTGSIYTSADGGATWIERPSAGIYSWTSVTSSADGTKLVAVAYSGYVFTSSDAGITWVKRASDTTRNWYSITSSSDGTKLAAVTSTYIYTSTNGGATWATSTTAGSKNWKSITSSADGTKLAAVAWNGQISTSQDSGLTWGVKEVSRWWTSITSSADGSKLVAGVTGGGSYLYTYKTFSPTLSVDIIYPQTGNSIPRWNPYVSWGVSKSCYYSYDNFISTSSIDCSLNGSDIPIPVFGNVTLYIKGISNMGVVVVKSVNFNNIGNPNILVNYPVLNSSHDATTWAPNINYSTTNASLTICQYSYNNFVSSKTADCSKKGSDIAPPSDGLNTLYIRTVDTVNNINIFSVSFTYLSHTIGNKTSGARYWQAVTSSSDGTKLAAVAGWAPSDYIYTSIDSGVTWATSTASGVRNWSTIASSADGLKLIAAVGPIDNYGISGYIYTSTTSGATWVQQTSAGSQMWISVTSSADGMKLAATAQSGYIWTSVDGGINWVQKTIDTTRYWKSITSSSDGTRLAASVYGGYIYTSTTSGATWATSTTAGSKNWASITSSFDGMKLVAVVDGGYIYVSSDGGGTWSQQMSDAVRGWRSITSSSDGTRLAAVAHAGYIYTSTDGGNTWSQRIDSVARLWRSIALSADGMKLAAVANNLNIYTLNMGGYDLFINSYITLNNPTASSSLNSFLWAPSVSWGFNKRYCYYSYNNFSSTSTADCLSGGSDIPAPIVDGVTTLYVKAIDLLNNISSTNVSFAYNAVGFVLRKSDMDFRSIASSADGSKLLASVWDGYMQTSTDGGITWKSVKSAGAGTTGWSWIAAASDFTGTKLVATVANGGNIYISTNSGATWAAKGPNLSWYSIDSSADGSKLIAGANGYLYTSNDFGLNWTKSTIISGCWTGVASSADGTKLAAVGRGYIYTSEDSGITWATSTGSISLGIQDWQDITLSADGTKLAAVAWVGKIYTSTDSGVTWTPRMADLNRPWKSITSSADGTKLTAVSSSGGQIYTSSDSGVTWTQNTYDIGGKNWYSITSSADGTKIGAVVMGGSGAIYNKVENPRVLSVDIILPQPGNAVPAWSPMVSWGTATSCYYSYNNFSSTSTVSCSLNGSDISAPSVAGSNTLYVKGIDASSTVKVASSTFTFSPHYWCGTVDSNWGNVNNWYTDATCTVGKGSLPATTSAAFLVGATSPIISASTTIPTLINSLGLTGPANISGVIFSGATTNTANIVGNVTFNNGAYNMGVVTGNAIFTTASSSTFILSGTMKWGGSISGTIKGIDGVNITNLIFNNSSSNETTIPSNFSTVFNNNASNNGIINGDATFNNTGLFTMGTVNGTSTLNALSQTLNGINNVVNLVKRIATAIRDTLFLTSGSTLNVSGKTTMLGYDASSLLSVRSTTPGLFANLNINGTSLMNFLRLKDIKNIGTLLNLSTNKVYDDGGNSGFTLNSSSTPAQRGITSPYTGSLSTPLYPGTINSCGVINQSGTYTLGGNLTNASGPCFTIFADNVTIDGGVNHYTVIALGGNTSYAVVATSSIINGGSAYGTTTIQNITFSGFGGGVNANGNNGTTGTTAGGNGGKVVVASSTLGTVTASGGVGYSTGIKGNGGNIIVNNSTTGNLTSSGTNGLVSVSGTDLNISNSTYISSSTLSVVYSGSLTTTNTILSATDHFIVSGTDYGVFAGGAFPILPGTINTCGNLTLSGIYTLGAGGVVGDCNILGSGIIIAGAGNTLTGNVMANNYGVTLSGVTVTGAVSSTGSGNIDIRNSSNLNGTISVAGILSGDGSSSLRNTTINVGASVATSSVSFVGDVINNGTINGGNAVAGKIINNGTINVGAVSFAFNASSTNPGTVNGNVILNASSTNSGTINGNAVLNASSINTGTITGDSKLTTLTALSSSVSFSGTTTFSGTGYVNGNIYDSVDSQITSWTFNASSTNAGYTIGDAVFNNTSRNTGTITGKAYFYNYSTNAGAIYGNADVYFPVTRPLGGSVGTISYRGYPGLYFNDQSTNDGGYGVAGKWNDVKNWWIDAGFNNHSSYIPIAGDDVIIYGNLTNGGPVSVRSATFENISSNGIYITVSSTSSDAVLFNGSSTNAVAGTINGNATFAGLGSDNFGAVTGHITRKYSSSFTVVGDIVHNASIYTVEVLDRATVNLSGAVYALWNGVTGTIFHALNNGVIVWNNTFGTGAPSLSVTSPVSGVNIKWTPSVNWDTSFLCQYKVDGGLYTSVDCSKSGNDISRPTAGDHVMFFKSADALGNLTEKSVSFTYNNVQPIDTDCSTPLDEATRQYYYLSSNVSNNCLVTASTTLRGDDGAGHYYSLSGNLTGSSSSLTLENITVTGTTSNFANLTVSSSTLSGAVNISGSISSDASSIFGDTTVNSGATVSSGNFTNLVNNGTLINSTSSSILVSGNTTNNGIINGDFVFNNSSINLGTVNGNLTLNGGSVNAGTTTGDLIFNTLSPVYGAVTFLDDANFLGTNIVSGNIKDSLGNNITKWIFKDTSSNTGYTKGEAFFNDSSTNAGTISGNAHFSDSSSNAFGTVNGNVDIYNTATIPADLVNGIITGTKTYHSYPNSASFENTSGDNDWNRLENWFAFSTSSVPLGRLPISGENIVLFASTSLPSDLTSNIFLGANDIRLNGANHKIIGNVSGDGAYGGYNAYNFDLSNVTVTGTTTAVGGDGVTGVSHGGAGGVINITTSSTGGVVVNGGDPELQNGGDAGTSTITNSFAVADGTRILAVGGASSGCGFGGNGGNIFLIDSSGYILVTATGEDATSTCRGVAYTPPTNRSSGRSSAVGIYHAPRSVSNTTPSPTKTSGSNSVRREMFNQGIINQITLPVQILKPVKLTRIPPFGEDKKGGFSFLGPIEKFVFSKRDITSSPDLYKYISTTLGLNSIQKLAKLYSKPLKLDSQSENVKGIFKVSSPKGDVLATLLKVDKKGDLSQYIKIKDYETLNISLANTPLTEQSKTITEGMLDDTKYTFINSKNLIATKINIPKKAGVYIFRTTISPISLVVEVVSNPLDVMNTNIEVKQSLWSKILWWFET